jgi:hypothetical protein
MLSDEGGVGTGFSTVRRRRLELGRFAALFFAAFLAGALVFRRALGRFGARAAFRLAMLTSFRTLTVFL